MEGLPEGVVGVEAVGKVTAEDYETVLIPTIDDATSGDAKAKVLIVFGSEFEGYEAGAALEDLKLDLRKWGDFERIAFVSGEVGYRALIRGLGFLMPGEVRVFRLEQLDEAKQWIAGVPNL